MTPTRAKRNSKAPNRFSSDSTQVEITTSTGDTTINHTDKNTLTNQTFSPASRMIKLKSATREPLKVKLPKLKRPHLQSATNNSSVKSTNNDQIKIHKIKLPSLSSKKDKSTNDESCSTKKATPMLEDHEEMRADSDISDAPDRITTSHHQNQSATLVNQKQTTDSELDISRSPISTYPHNISATSKSSDAQKSADTSLSSEDNDPSEMVITVTRVDSPEGSGIRCPCGVDDDLGVMVECEKCSLWQHGHCINVGTEDDAYEGYICAFCALDHNHARETLKQLYILDKFQSRFEILESLMDQNPTSITENVGLKDKVTFSVEELCQAISDLNRVSGSLRVKWRLLTSQSYEIELRIWQNPFWSNEKTDTNKDKNFYFLDRCKQNLKLNVRNMVRKMETRCRVISLAMLIALSSKSVDSEIDNSEKVKLEKAQESLSRIEKSVQEIKLASDRVDQLSN